LRLREPGLIEKAAQHGDTFGARRKCAEAGVADVTHTGCEPRCQRESDVKAIHRQRSGGAIRPFDEDHRLIGQVFEAELGKFGRASDTIEVTVNQGETRQFVILHQSESRARHLDRVVG
jgi:hypothetical protein